MKADVYALMSEYEPEGRGIIGLFASYALAKKEAALHSGETSIEVCRVYGGVEKEEVYEG